MELDKIVVNFFLTLSTLSWTSPYFKNSNKNTPVQILKEESTVLSRITEVITLTGLKVSGLTNTGRMLPNHKWPKGAPYKQETVDCLAVLTNE